MANLIWDSAGEVWKGTFTISNDGTGNSNETYTIDLGDAQGPVTVTLDGINTTIYPGATNSINVTDCSSWSLSAPSTVTEGDSVTITLNTTNVPDGLIPFSISGSGIDDGDISHGAGQDVIWDAANSKFEGNFNLSGNTASITLNIIDDGVGTGGSETFTLSLDNGESSVNVTINDPAAPASCGDQIADWSTGEDNSLTTSGVPSQQTTLGNYGAQGWDTGGTLYLPELDGNGISPSSFFAQNPDTGSIGLLKYVSNPITTDFYYEHNGVCYKGVITADGLTSSTNPQILTVVP